MQHQSPSSYQPSKTPPLRVVAHPNAFGAHLRFVRQRQQISSREVAEALVEYFEYYHVTFPTADPVGTYHKIERGVRAVQFEELLSLYATLVGCGILQSTEERHTFVRLARLKLESLQRKRPKPRSNSDWEELEAQLAQIEQQPALKKRQTGAFDTTLHQASLDIRHVVGRDQWLTTALSYLETEPPKKLIVIQGLMGSGKSTCLKLLLHTLGAREGYHPILHLFAERQDMLAEEHFDHFLASTLAKLEVVIPETKVPGRQEQVQLLLNHLTKAKQRVVLLLDDVQVILDAQGRLPAVWEQFFAEYLNHSHHATIYLATREWTMWTGRERVYIVDGDEAMLSPISLEAGVYIWQRCGFCDVEEAWLQRATKHLGGNPRLIELRAATLQRRKLAFSWQKSQAPTPRLATHPHDKSEQQELIEELVNDTRIFGTADVEVNKLLQQAVSQRISHDARQLLEVLAVSPLALPFPLLHEVSSQAEYAFVELLNASLIDRVSLMDERAALQPLTREAMLHQLLVAERVDLVEQHIIQLYKIWIEQGIFQDDHQQAALVAELTILLLKHQQLLEAAELVISYGWLPYALGYARRLVRIAQQVLDEDHRKWQTPQQEIAAKLLHYRLASYIGEKVSTKQRGSVYWQLRKQAEEEHVYLSPATEVCLMKPIIISFADSSRFEEAQAIVDEHLDRVRPLQEKDPATYASYLYYHAYLLAKWGEYEEDLEQLEQYNSTEMVQRAKTRFEGAALLYKECIGLLHQSAKGATSLKKSTLFYKLARHLNDYAYYARRSGGSFPDIEDALRESLDLKRQGYALPISIPITYGEYAQYFASIGQYQKALEQSNLALSQMEQLVQENYPTARRELAVLQVERGELHLLLGNMDEAQQLFEQAKEYVQKSVRRKHYKRKVEEGLQTIEHMKAVHLPPGRETLRGQLDYRWFNRYKDIADYDTFGWLEPSGPFSREEQQEWNRLASQSDQGQINDAMKELMKVALQRELDAAIEAQRDPSILYPVIPIDRVRQKINACLRLRDDIAYEEVNVVVRSLYLDTLDEHLNLLHLIEACFLDNAQTFSRYNHQLNDIPNAQEMEVATRALLEILKKGIASPQTESLSLKVFHTLQDLLLLSPYWNIQKYLPEQTQSYTGSDQENPLLTIEAIRACFEAIFTLYGFDDWSIKLDPSARNARVEQNTHELILPKRSMRLDKVFHLLAHEIECHIYRFANGERSKLSLLGYGTANSLATEEALATLYSAQVEQKTESIPWIGTLAVGLASGAKSPLGGRIKPQNFYRLYCLMRDYHQLNLMLNGKEEQAAEKSAHRLALARCLRTWRGSPLQSGVCFTKDNCYLRGYLLLQKALEQAQKEGVDLLERLQVGAIAIEHVGACEQLGITKPIISHKRLAFDSQIRKYILSFQEKIQLSSEVIRKTSIDKNA